MPAVEEVAWLKPPSPREPVRLGCDGCPLGGGIPSSSKCTPEGAGEKKSVTILRVNDHQEML